MDEENWANNKQLVSQFNAIAAQHDSTPAQLSLAWVLAQGEHVHAIPGTAAIPHLEENFKTLNLMVGNSTLEEISALINQGAVSGHRYPEAMRNTIDTEDF